LVHKTEFRIFINYTDFLVSLLSFSEYWHHSQKALSVLVRMSTTYFVSKYILLLSKMSKKRENQSRKLIFYERGSSKGLQPRFSQPADEIQQQPKH